MDVIIMARDCEPPRDLQACLGEALKEALGPLADELPPIEIFVETREGQSPRACRMQAVVRPYGSLGCETVDLASRPDVRRAVSRMSWRVRSAIDARSRIGAVAT